MGEVSSVQLGEGICTFEVIERVLTELRQHLLQSLKQYFYEALRDGQLPAV
jgi:hypothetical protein